MELRKIDAGEAGFVTLRDKGEVLYGIWDDALTPGCGLFMEGCSCGFWSGASAF